ncbi:MAG: D-alanyl-D-alanine carboxypeptidase/D-alanyl-D-alanine-endopeptidase [Ideonella sp.]|nr:D-alanyl-D-alanine carboxypeptidase/D-alanyl-D-alanine-endopeptidase [Ideonella sp.]
MPSSRLRLCSMLLPLWLAACASVPPRAPAGLPPAVAGALQCARLPDSALGVQVAALDTPAGGPVLAHQAERSMQPGSTMKIVTSVVALDRLGPNHRGYTELLTAAPQQGEVLLGDLVLRGGADPELELPQLWQMLQELRWQGVRRIDGDIVLDRRLFRPERPDLGLPPFDDSPEFPYNVVPDALNLGGSLVGLELRADGERVQARLLPPLDGVEIDSRLALNDRPCRDWDDDWTTSRVETAPDGTVKLVLQGAFPRACTQRVTLQLFDRDLQAERQLRWLWQDMGGTWRGRVRSGATPPGARRIARHDARPWGELLRPLNKRSDNVYARLLYLSLGVADAAAHPELTSQALSDRVVRDWFVRQGISTDGLVMDNGSGLSRSERIGARQMVEVLRAGLSGPNAADLLMSLPTVGVDGTMRNRQKDSVAAGRARLKSGTLRNVTAVAGTVTDVRGRVWLVAAMLNDEAAGSARRVLDVLVDWVARTGLAAEGWREAPAPCPPR